MRIAQIVWVLLLVGCMKAPGVAHRVEAAAKRFQAPPEMARVYLYRDTELDLMEVTIGDVVAVLGFDSFFIADLPPGTYQILRRGHDRFAATYHGGILRGAEKITVDGGKLYFVRISNTKNGIDFVDIETGRKAVERYTMAWSTQIPSSDRRDPPYEPDEWPER